MTTEMDKQNRRASRILRQFGRYVEAAAQSSLDTPTIARTKPRTYAIPPANRGEALARCRDMAPIADKAQQEAAQ